MSPAQKDTVLEAIAIRSSTLSKLLMMIQTEEDKCEAGVLVDAAQQLAETIGAMADDATGGGIYGDVRQWFYGPLFNDVGVSQ